MVVVRVGVEELGVEYEEPLLVAGRVTVVVRVGTLVVFVREGVVGVVVDVLAGVVLLLVAGRVTVVVRVGTVVVVVVVVRAGVVVVVVVLVLVLEVGVVASVFVLTALVGLETSSKGLSVAPRVLLSAVLLTASLLTGALVEFVVDVCDEEDPPLAP